MRQHQRFGMIWRVLFMYGYAIVHVLHLGVTGLLQDVIDESSAPFGDFGARRFDD